MRHVGIHSLQLNATLNNIGYLREEKQQGIDIAVSYTHLDVYKRQWCIYVYVSYYTNNYVKYNISIYDFIKLVTLKNYHFWY